MTIITHGFASNVNDWIIPMAGKVGEHPAFPGETYSCYQISITRNGSGQYVGERPPCLAGPSAAADRFRRDRREARLVDALERPTSDRRSIAEAAANALLAPNLDSGELGGRPLAELPLHLVGHSRGGSVVTEMARLLGAQGVWVDQVTTLDPRPVSQFGDATVTTWTNVLFADNYWQTFGDDFIVPNGRSSSAPTTASCSSLPGGYSSSHSDVHLWYHGTIDLATPTSDTQANITAAERSAWWTSAESAGATAGFFYSLIGGGDRLSSARAGRRWQRPHPRWLQQEPGISAAASR